MTRMIVRPQRPGPLRCLQSPLRPSQRTGWLSWSAGTPRRLPDPFFITAAFDFKI